MEKNLGTLLLVTTTIFVIFGQELSEKHYEMKKISIDDNDLLKYATKDKYKGILRYGFHRTDACQSFDKAFVCIRKCLDFGYQIAECDIKCQCKCYRNKGLAAHKLTISPNLTSVTSWKFWAPTTSRPSWAKLPKDDTDEVKISDKELFADLSPDNDDASGSESSDVIDNGGKSKNGNGSGDANDENGVTEAEARGSGDAGAGGSGDAEAGGQSDAEAGSPSDAEAGGQSDAEAGGSGDAEAGGPSDAEAGGSGDAEAGGSSDANAEGESEAEEATPEE